MNTTTPWLARRKGLLKLDGDSPEFEPTDTVSAPEPNEGTETVTKKKAKKKKKTG